MPGEVATAPRTAESPFIRRAKAAVALATCSLLFAAACDTAALPINRKKAAPLAAGCDPAHPERRFMHTPHTGTDGGRRLAVLRLALPNATGPSETLGLGDPVTAHSLIDNALTMMRVGTCGAYQPERVDYFGNYLAHDLPREAYCESDARVFAAVNAAKKEAAEEDHYKESDYDTTVVIADFNDCGKLDDKLHAGVAYVGGNTAVVHSRHPRVLVHEWGHQRFGLAHSSSVACGNHAKQLRLTDNGDVCKRDEYGDPSSVMGDVWRDQLDRDVFNGYEMAAMGIITPSQIKEISSTQTHTIEAIMNDSSGTKMILVPMKNPEIQRLMPTATHYAVELSGNSSPGGPHTPCQPEVQRVERFLCNTGQGVSLKVYVGAFVRVAGGWSPRYNGEHAVLKNGHGFDYYNSGAGEADVFSDTASGILVRSARAETDETSRAQGRVSIMVVRS